MTRFVLPIVTLLVALASCLTWSPAPPWMGLWKLAVAVSEFGHWWVIIPGILAALSWQLLERWPRVVALGCCGVAFASLLFPVAHAARIARRLPAELADTFGEAARAPAPALEFSRLYWQPALERVPVVTETFARRGDEELLLDFYAPVGAQGPAPCIIVVHGGGWDGGDRLQLQDWNHRLAHAGYAVAAVSYRLAPRHRWPAPREDLFAAIRWIKASAARLGVDATRLVLLGRSAGGQIAAAVAYAAEDPAIVGVISLYAPQDMQFAWSVSRDDDALNSVKLMRQYFGGGPDTVPLKALYDSASAQLMVNGRTPPTLLIHGEPDALVWHRHSVRLAERLREARVPHYLLSLPWATHAFDFNADGPGGQLADYSIRAFLHSVTKPRP